MNDIFYNMIVPLLLEDDRKHITNRNRRALRLVNKRTLAEITTRTWVPRFMFMEQTLQSFCEFILSDTIRYNPQVWCVYCTHSFWVWELAEMLVRMCMNHCSCHLIFCYNHENRDVIEHNNVVIYNDSEYPKFNDEDIVVCMNVQNRRMIRRLKQHRGLLINFETCSTATIFKQESPGHMRRFQIQPVERSPVAIKNYRNVRNVLVSSNNDITFFEFHK
jgi:hypothetical protein